MNDSSEAPPVSEAQAKAEHIERTKVLLKAMESWRNRVEAMDLKRGTPEYGLMHNEFWLGAAVMAAALDKPISPILTVYLMAGRDILDLENTLKERLV